MRRFIYLLLFSLFTNNNIIFAGCSNDTINQLFSQLQPNIPWLDITPTDPSNGFCMITIRYFPCEIPIDSLLRQSVTVLKPRCLLLRGDGAHTIIEGYCALENIWLTCLSGIADIN